MNTITYFEIQSSEPAREADFYQEVFGWDIQLDESAPFTYYRITTDGLAGAILGRPLDPPPATAGTNAFTCSIRVKNFDATARLILEHGGAVSLPKFAIAGLAWWGYFTDPDNNVFGIFEEDASARVREADAALISDFSKQVRDYPGKSPR
ncbi:MAG: VOC family protein [Propionibacteriaceae bacterium]|jgi:predicted enzyme related to lactoylglutathione lyase|nr:VOC family protein [Propionibacteriaceae bacterium]